MQQQQQKSEKVRIFALARELGMESKDLVVFCQQNGLDVKSQLSTIEPEVRDQILQLVKKGAAAAAPNPPPAPAPVTAPAPKRNIANLDQRRGPTPKQEPPRPPQATPPPADVQAPTAPPVSPVAAPTPPVRPLTSPTQPPVITPAASAPPAPPAVAQAAPPTTVPQETPVIAAEQQIPPAPVTPAAKPVETPAARPTEQPAIAARPTEVVKPAQVPPPVRPAQTPAVPQTPAVASRPAAAAGPVPTGASRPVRNLAPARPSGQGNSGGSSQGGGGGGGGQGGDRTPRSMRPGPGRTTGYASGGPRPVQPNRTGTGTPTQDKKPAQPTGAKKLGEITPEMMAAIAGREILPSPKELEEIRQRHDRQTRAAAAGATPGVGTPPPAPTTEEEDEERRGAGHRAGAVPGRADRHKERSERQKSRKTDDPRGGGGRIDINRIDDEPRHRKARPHQKIKKKPTEERKGKVPIYLPITVRSFSEAIGRKALEVIFKLKDHGNATATINSGIEPEIAELIALDFGKELDIKRSVDVEQDLMDLRAAADNPEDLQPRAPIVTIMGHVDHGKTSLLDRIRETYGVRSDVVSTEAGGITQVIRAWRVEKDGKPITFLDTPGHEAFTKMRARGANVTDIAVIVVAANDGVMPQTEEAINHAKAAGVSIVVAINKVDLPDANLGRTERRLMEMGLIPDNMGGDVPFVQTSAKTGKGIDELLEQLSVVAELKELKANPNKPGTGTCLEAHKSEKEGVQATLLVREGTLRTGDVVLCGSSFGTVRRMYDDMGHTTETAGPSVPVRILGLDEVPNADDPFLVVQDVSTAGSIAKDRKARELEKALAPRKVLNFDNLAEAQIAELKVILKAEARGSIEAIRNELEKLQHDEVRVRVLHAAIGGITVSDVQLALTSPEDTLILGFNVVPDNDAKALAEERGIQLKQYNIIYQLADDIRSALEGKLKPREEIIPLGRAIVRNTFRISRVGTIAGCYVTQGVLERNAKVRVIRQGLVVYPPAERTASLESLKRFKDDAREVREGFECGLKIAGYDDIKVDDAIECYRIEQVQRTLDK